MMHCIHQKKESEVEVRSFVVTILEGSKEKKKRKRKTLKKAYVNSRIQSKDTS